VAQRQRGLADCAEGHRACLALLPRDRPSVQLVFVSSPAKRSCVTPAADWVAEVDSWLEWIAVYGSTVRVHIRAAIFIVWRRVNAVAVVLILAGVNGKLLYGGDDVVTIGHQLLKLEGDDVPGQARELLDYILRSAVGRFGEHRQPLADAERALFFFRSVEETICAAGGIFPPRGDVDLLRNALAPRGLSESDYQVAESSIWNMRRRSWMRAHRASGDPLYFFDCDTAAVIYLAVAQQLNLPVCLVEMPGHTYLRWVSEKFVLNWDPNEATSISDAEYFRRWRVSPSDQRLFGYGECRSEAYLRSYWSWLVGQWHSRRGEYQKAEYSFRAATRLARDNLVAQNELAWFLATCPESSLRDGKEAVSIAQSLVDKSPRIVWIDTLAAAYAECGDFQKARDEIARARILLQSNLGGVGSNERVADLELTGKLYEEGKTFAQGVAEGRIPAATVPAALNDVQAVPER
jgi:hypothetical protein